MAINERVKKLRESLNLDKSSMARLIDMSPQTFGSIENDEGGISMANLIKFGKNVKNLNLTWFLLDIGEMWLSENSYESEKRYNTDSNISEDNTEYKRSEKNLLNTDEVMKKQIELLLVEMKRMNIKMELMEKEVERLKKNK